MSLFTMPLADALNPVGGGGVFPEGSFVMQLESVERQNGESIPEFMWDPPRDLTKRPRLAGNPGDAERLKIVLGSGAPATPDDPDPGERKFFVDLIIRDGGVDVQNLHLSDESDRGWLIERDVRLLGNLAFALGAYAIDEDAGEVHVEDSFVDDLADHHFDGRPVKIRVYHARNKNNPDKPYVNLGEFAPADEN